VEIGRQAYYKKYRESEQGKATLAKVKEYRQSEEGKRIYREYQRWYRTTEAGKAAKAKYGASEKYRNWQKEYYLKVVKARKQAAKEEEQS
jgi:hypothetical protein